MRTLRPGADQSSKAAFGKSAFAQTCFLLLKIRLVHINRAKSKNAFEHALARFSHGRLARWRKRKSCDVGEAREGLENELWHRCSNEPPMVLAESILLVACAKTCSKVLLLFVRLVCASHTFNKRKHVGACFSKSAFAKSSFARLVCARPKAAHSVDLTRFKVVLKQWLLQNLFYSISEFLDSQIFVSFQMLPDKFDHCQ